MEGAQQGEDQAEAGVGETSGDRGSYVCCRSARSPRGLWQGHSFGVLNMWVNASPQLPQCLDRRTVGH